MRMDSEVRRRIRGLLSMEFGRRVHEACERLPHLCKYNHRQPLDFRKQLEGSVNDGYNLVSRKSLPVVDTIGLCLYGSEDPSLWNGDICEEPVDAKRCPYFTTVATKKSIYTQFRAQVSDPEWVEENLPSVYELMWCLNVDEAPPLPWWRRLLFWVLRIRVEPVLKSGSPLLPGELDRVYLAESNPAAGEIRS